MCWYLSCRQRSGDCCILFEQKFKTVPTEHYQVVKRIFCAVSTPTLVVEHWFEMTAPNFEASCRGAFFQLIITLKDLWLLAVPLLADRAIDTNARLLRCFRMRRRACTQVWSLRFVEEPFGFHRRARRLHLIVLLKVNGWIVAQTMRYTRSCTRILLTFS